MFPRVLIAGLTFSFTAFAPAPFLHRKGTPVDARGMEGLWEVIERNTAPGKKGLPLKTFIEIGPGSWSFRYEKGGEMSRGVKYALRIGEEGGVGTFDLRRNADDPAAYGRGIWRREGNELRIAYRFRSDRPKDFQPAVPRSVVLRLRRVKP